MGGRPNVTERTIDDDNAPSFSDDKCVMCYFHGFMFCNVPFFIFLCMFGLGNTTGDERGKSRYGLYILIY